MSLAINTTTPDGLVLAADSRQSFRNRKGQARVGSDSAVKIFELSKSIGLLITGPAFLEEDGVLKNVSKFVDDFKESNLIEGEEVSEVAKKLHKFFDEKYNYRKDLEALPEKIRQELNQKGLEVVDIKQEDGRVIFRFKDKEGKVGQGLGGVDQLAFIIAGYNPDGSHQVFMVYVPGIIEEKRSSRIKGREYGASWAGQIDVIARVVLGRDPRLSNLSFVQQAAKNLGEETVQRELSGLEYAISWGTMNLQDSIDFSVLMIQTTSAIQRFSDGILMDPGDITGVGGPVDVAVITPNKGFVWVNRKSLGVGDSIIDLDKLPNVQTNVTNEKKSPNTNKK
jgi:hypothetical protein